MHYVLQLISMYVIIPGSLHQRCPGAGTPWGAQMERSPTWQLCDLAGQMGVQRDGCLQIYVHDVYSTAAGKQSLAGYFISKGWCK